MEHTYQVLVKKSTYFVLLSALLLILIKGLGWWLTNSMSLLASLLDSSVDFLASATNFALVRYAFKPADKEHTFGHGKAESLAALAQSAFIIGSAAFLFLNGIKSLMNPSEVVAPTIGAVVTLVSIVITVLLVSYQRWVIGQTQSQAVKADMLHYASDLLTNIAVLLALFLSWSGFVYADALFAIMIAGYIAYSAVKIGFVAIQSLLDHALPEHDNARILAVASAPTQVLGIHDLKTRQSGPLKFIQLHLELPADMTLGQAHAIADQVEHQLRTEFSPAEVIIHQDPISEARLSERLTS